MSSSDSTRYVIIGGAGQVGQMFVDLLVPHGEVVVIDPAASENMDSRMRAIRSDVEELLPEVCAELAAADGVLLALPESLAVTAVPAVASAMQVGAMLIDTLSVKSRIVPLVTEWSARRQLQACSVNPMFAPALGIAGRPVMTIRIAPGARIGFLLSTLVEAGARLVEVTAEEHDHLTAILQVATHASLLAFGQTLATSDIAADTLLSLAPPPHLTLLTVLARIVSGQPDVYWDIQNSGSQATEARVALRRGLSDLDHWIDEQDQQRFYSVFRHIGEYLGEDLEILAGRCEQLFSSPPLTGPNSRTAR